MILDTLDNAARYTGLRNGFSKAFGFLNQPGLADLPAGTYTVSSNQIFAVISHETGRRPEEVKLLECHRKYIDIQYVINGDESIGWSPRAGLENSIDYDEEKDIEFFKGMPQSIIRISPGSFVLFFPTDAHSPLIGNGPIHKVVMKVAI